MDSNADSNVVSNASDRVDSVTIRLDYPTAFDGVVRDTLTLRRPKVRDMRAAQKIAPGDEEGAGTGDFRGARGRVAERPGGHGSR